MLDVLIIGGGVAGLSTALWCDELELSALMLEAEAEPGGQLLWVHNEIGNYLGREAQNGRELRDVFLEQTAARRFETRLGARVAQADPEEKQILLTGGERFSARAIVVATGIRRRRLGIAGEEEFKGRGLIASGKQSADEVAGKNAVIVGGGDAAFENALILAETARRVTLVHRRAAFSARREFVRKVEAHPRIEILTEAAAEELAGGARLESVRIRHLGSGERRVLPADVVLIRIGVEPNTEIFRGKLKLDRAGYIEIDRDCGTSVEGVYAVGDVANPLAPTIASAAGMGATAAKAILSWLNTGLRL